MTAKAHIIRVPSEAGRTSESLIPSLESVNFPYFKTLFHLRLVLVSVMIALVGITISPLFLDVPLNWTAGILGLLFVYLFFSAISPFLTSHTLTAEELILRQGWYFRAVVPLDEIESVEKTREFVFTGVKFSILDNKIYVAGSRRGLVKIMLKEARRFVFALGKLANEILIDVRDSDRFVELMNERLGFHRRPIPANQDLSSWLQS